MVFSIRPMPSPKPRGSPVPLVVFRFPFDDQDPIKAVEYIRDRRRGAINRKQLTYLDSYVRRSRANGCSSCVVM